MANWTGNYSITTPGTTLTGATSTTATNTGASWPTSPSLAGWQIRLLTGPGSPALVPIVSNTSTVITVAAWPNGTPNNTTTYELVARFANSDAITGALTFGTNCIVESDDSATVTVNGAFAFSFQNSCTVRLGKTASTVVTFCALNRTTAGKESAWTGISFLSTLSVSPSFSFIKIQDATTGLTLTPSTGLGTASGVFNLWFENCGTNILSLTGAAAGSNMVVKNVFARYTAGNLVMGSSSSTFSQILDSCWVESSSGGNVNYAAGGSNLQWLRNSVMKSCSTSLQVNANSGVEFRLSECYFAAPSPVIVVSNSSNTDAGIHNAFMNSVRGSRFIAGAGTGGSGTLKSFSNDLMGTGNNNNAQQGISISAATTYASATSNFDYLSGNNSAAYENVDTTTGTTSSATPNQYENLTSARTNAQSSPNFPMVIDNISVGTPTSHAVTIGFDCQNGAQSGQGSTVNADSASGQPTLNCASTTWATVGATVEIGYGTARAEVQRIASISAGVSVTFENNLTFTHTAAQADTVKLQLRNYGLPFVRYGTASGQYTMQTQVPDQSVWGLLWTGFQSLFNGEAFSWKRTGHSVALSNLQAGTTYYATPYAYNPFGELIAGTEQTFTTPSSSATIASTFS